MLIDITAGPNKGRRCDMPTSQARLAIAGGWASTAERTPPSTVPPSEAPPRVNAQTPAVEPPATLVAAPRPRRRRA